MKREKNRRQRKARWIRVKNHFRKSEYCDGVFWTNHIYEPEHPWVWVDFLFLSERHPRRYYAVAARTLEYKVLDDIENEVYEIVDEREPFEEQRLILSRNNGEFEVYFSEPVQNQQRRRMELFKELYPLHLNQRTERATIEVRREYGDVAIGLWVTLNTPHIDSQVIHAFIKQFRDLGEPIAHGIVWTGEEVNIDAREVNERYRRIFSAKS